MGTPLSIRVFLFRQVAVELRGQKAWRTCVLGEGKLAPTVPTTTTGTTSQTSATGSASLYDLPSPRYSPTSDGAAHESLDWDGVVKVMGSSGSSGSSAQAQGTDVGGFTAGSLTVKVSWGSFLPVLMHLLCCVSGWMFPL
jgi:hypothetical protein